MYHPSLPVVLLAACVLGCDQTRSEAAASEPSLATGAAAAVRDSTCEIVSAGAALPMEVRETSGLARSTRDPDLFWTHNDAGNDPHIFGIGSDGRLVQRVRVMGAALVDWEDIEVAPCDDRSCLFLGDIGDNDGDREGITIYRVGEPPAGATETGPVEALRARFPDGPRDAEALFADAAGSLYVVSKGRQTPITLYRYPAPQRPGELVTLERVRDLFPEPREEAGRVTAAASTPDGRWVGIRTYRTLYLFPMDALVGDGAVAAIPVDLSSLGEAQGEGVVLADDGTVWLSSEAAGDGRAPRWYRLRCRLPDG